MAGYGLRGFFMKKFVLLLVFGMIFQLSAANLGKFDKEAQSWHVSNGKFSCTFFEGCMYPAWFSDAGKREFPFFVMDDFLTVNGGKYKLIEERWAEFDVKENSSSRFVIAINGQFCNGLPPFNTPYKNIDICYQYTIERNSDIVKIDITAQKKKNEDVRFYFVRPRWRFLPFRLLKTADGSNIALEQRFKKQKEFECDSVVLLHDSMPLKFSTGKQIVKWENRENGFLTVAEKAGEIFSPANNRKVTFSTTLQFGGDIK